MAAAERKRPVHLEPLEPRFLLSADLNPFIVEMSQRFFRRYQRLAGVTGTASEVKRELASVYRLTVVRVPPNRPTQRTRLPIRIFPTVEQKWKAIAARAAELRAAGHAVLIGTRSITASEAVSRLLSEAGLEHEVKY